MAAVCGLPSFLKIVKISCAFIAPPELIGAPPCEIRAAETRFLNLLMAITVDDSNPPDLAFGRDADRSLSEVSGLVPKSFKPKIIFSIGDVHVDYFPMAD